MWTINKIVHLQCQQYFYKIREKTAVHHKKLCHSKYEYTVPVKSLDALIQVNGKITFDWLIIQNVLVHFSQKSMSEKQQEWYAQKQLTNVSIHFSVILRRISCQQELFKLTGGWKLSALLDDLFLVCGRPPFQKLA